MVKSGVILAFIGTLLFKFANSAAIDYEPIKIIVNENFNTHPGQVFSELQTLEPGVLHQGANFYFKPQVNLPQSFIPSHIEDLMSFIQQHQECSKDPSKFAGEKNKLMEILKSFMYTSSDISKENPSKIVFEKENNLGNVKPPGFIPPALEEIEAEPQPVPAIIAEESKPVKELLVIPEAPVLPSLSLSSVHSPMEEEVKNDESALLEEQTGAYPTIPEITVRPIQEPIFTYVQTKPMTSELITIPEAPVLPSLSFNGIPSNVKKEIIKEESVITEAQRGVFPTISGIAVGPIQESIINYDESKTAISELGHISDASVLSQTDNSNPEEPIISYVEPKPIITEIEVIREAPVLPPLSANDITLVEEGMKVDEPIVVDVQPKPAIQELEEIIPEAPMLSPLVLHDVPYIVKEEVKKEESELLKESTGVFSTGPEAAVRPIQELIFNYAEPKSFITEFQVIPEALILPPLSANDITLVEEGMKVDEPIVVDVQSKPAIQELEEIIPEAPVLSPLVLHDIPYIVKEEVRKEESKVLKEPTGVFPTGPEAAVKPIQELIFNYAEPKPFITEFQVIPEAPVLPPLLANDVTLVEEGMKIEEPIVVDVESKPAIQELEEVIPEPPVLPPLVHQDVPSIIKEEVEKEESKILKEPTGVFHIIPETERPVQEPVFNYVELKPFITEFQIIPEAPVLSPLVLHDVPYIVNEGERKNESELLKEPTGVFPIISEAAVKPVQEPIFNYAEPKPFLTELQVIPEAPVLSSLSTNSFKLIESGVKIEEPNDIVVDPKLATSQLGLIPEAPILPPVSKIPLVEDLLTEETTTKAESTDRPSIPEIFVRPIDPELFDVEPKPVKSNHIVMSESLILPALSFNVKPSVGEEVKTEEPIKIEESTGMFTENSARPISEPITVSESAKHFVLENNNSPVATKVNIEIPILLEESIEIFPPIAERPSEPTLEPIQELKMTNSYVLEEVSQLKPEHVSVKETLPPRIIPKPSNNLGVFSYAPFVSHLSNRATKMKKLTIPKAASLERFLLKKHPFKFPIVSVNEMMSPIKENKIKNLYPTSYAHNVVEKRIAPSSDFKKYAPPKHLKIYVRSQV